MAQQARVQTRDLQGNNQLRAAPMQSDTFTAPARPAVDQNLSRLADALGSFSGSLGTLSSAMATSGDKKKEAWAMNQKYAGWSPQQWNEAVVAGQVPGGTTTETMAINSMAGDGMGLWQSEQLVTELQTSTDWNATDVEARVRQQMADTLKQYGDDPSFGEPYARRMEATLGSVRTMRMGRDQDNFEQAKKDGAYSHLTVTLADADKAGLDPKQKAGAILNAARSLGKDGVLVMDNAAVDQEILNLAARIADDDPETALALIGSKRLGSKGETLPAIGDKRTAADRVESIKSVAASAIDERSFAAQSSDYARQGLDALKAGNYDQFDGDKVIQLPSGTVKKIEGSALKDTVMRAFEADSDAFAVSARETPNATIAREERAFSMAGINNPRVERSLTNLASTVNQSLIQDEEARGKFFGKLAVYETIKKNSSARLRGYTKDQDREVAEATLIARNDLGMDDEQAIRYAVGVTSVLNPENLPSVVYFQDEISTGVDNVMNRTYGFDPDAANYSAVHAKITQLAKYNTAQGLKPKVAIEKAVKAIQGASRFYNGAVLNNVNGHGPEDFEGVSGTLIQKFLDGPARKQTEAGALDFNNIILMPIDKGDNTRFGLYEKDDMAPVKDDDGNTRVISLDAMRQHEVSTKKAAEDAARKTVVDEHAKKAIERGPRATREDAIRKGKVPGFLEREGITIPSLAR